MFGHRGFSPRHRTAMVRNDTLSQVMKSIAGVAVAGKQLRLAKDY